jgi:hypothetical protein
VKHRALRCWLHGASRELGVFLAPGRAALPEAAGSRRPGQHLRCTSLERHLVHVTSTSTCPGAQLVTRAVWSTVGCFKPLFFSDLRSIVTGSDDLKASLGLRTTPSGTTCKSDQNPLKRLDSPEKQTQ